MVVTSDAVDITAAGLPGLFYGVQTLLQLMSNNATSDASVPENGIPAMTIQDGPEFKWRGLHLDVARHFFTAEEVMRFLDVMASFKLNRLHWHLTDDQGWRLPIPGYPLLTEKGAGPRWDGENMTGEGVIGEGIDGFYTEEDIQKVLQCAKERHIEVMPEIDVPGHASAAISAYPYLGNTDDEPPEGPVSWFGLMPWTMSPTQGTLEFMEAVVAQLTKLFPGNMIHVGGDEVPRHQSAQTLITAQLSKILAKYHKQMAVWDEAQHMPGLSLDTVVFAWRSGQEMKKALQDGRHVVNADRDYLYFDRIQGDSDREPKGQPWLVTTQNVYKACSDFAKQNVGNKLVLGAQGELWSEYISTFDHLTYMAFPRTMALAECVWTNPLVKGPLAERSRSSAEEKLKTNIPQGQEQIFGSFARRLHPHLKRLQKKGIKTHKGSPKYQAEVTAEKKA
eukprot:gnl/TRDRNA2_/TRDRNA2_173290_c3_seq12.p1 gnl/TRDRNA2_/TRDRNA2_173290_c3~~gnl/TRDRNA2_/TRDRNA2_173290_c3_seq12.p1  ORF type:complete len:449 (+),score=81.08 gnl/TRDRNA2_/TRDRNA2_173290_c3_seq12:804-2150(+)